MSEIKVITTIVDGLPIPEKSKVEVKLDEEFIVINQTKLNGFKFEVINTFKVKLENVLDIAVATEKEIIDMNKSVIGRGAVGMIFGPVGAILGGMSGIGTKKVIKKKDTLFVISYVSKDEEIKNITFKVNDSISKITAKSFALIVKQKYMKKRNENLMGQNVEL
ncbi:hypothetical protein [Paraclostridium sordellii]|uniref:hypothetical protein n=1 Tax=Paraclostridium sordellii TaxID=1505 RepID=UPI00070F7C4A|nr:hypothetical protein [Paeniclostridium sordellii]